MRVNCKRRASVEGRGSVPPSVSHFWISRHDCNDPFGKVLWGYPGHTTHPAAPWDGLLPLLLPHVHVRERHRCRESARLSYLWVFWRGSCLARSLGGKNSLTAVWAKGGSPPPQPKSLPSSQTWQEAPSSFHRPSFLPSFVRAQNTVKETHSQRHPARSSSSSLGL
jgi:hypothetical protein